MNTLESKNKTKVKINKKNPNKASDFKNILDRITDGVAAVDENWNYLYINSKGAELLNVDAENLIGQNLWQYFPDAAKMEVGDSMRKAMKEQQYVFSENYYPPFNRWYENHFYPSEHGMTYIFKDITQKKKTESALKEVEEKFRTLYEENPLMNFQLSADGIVLSVNKIGALELGYTTEELIGNSVLTVFKKEDHEAVQNQLKQCIANLHKPFSWTMQKIKKDGEIIYVSETGTALTDKFNNIYILIVCENITDKIKYETELRKSEERFRMLIENSHDAITLMNEKGEITYVSPAVEKISGFTEKEIIGKKLTEFLSPDGSQEANEFFEKLFNNPGITLYESATRLLHKNGNYIWVEATVTNLLHDNNLKSIITNYRDVTARVEAQEALKRSEGKFRMLIENSHEAICLLNEKKEITYLSPAGERIIGFKSEEIIGRNLQDFFHSERPQTVVEFFNEIFEIPGKAFYNVNRFLKKNGDYMFADVSVTNMLHDQNVKAIITNFRDVTERINAEQALEKSKLYYKLLIEQAPEGVFISDEDDSILNVNSKGCEMLGYSLNELQKLKITDLIDPENLTVNPANPNDYTDGKTVIMERVLFKKDATKIEVEISGRMLEDGTFLAFVRDISDRKLIEEKLKTSESHLRSIIEAEPQCIKLLNKKGEVLEMNSAGLKMIEADSFDQVKGLLFHKLVTPEYKKEFAAITNEVFKGKSKTLTFELVGLKGLHRWLETHAVPLRDFNNEITSLLSVTRDISDKIIAENYLRKSELNYQSLVEQAPDGIFITGPDHFIIEANTAAKNMLGYDLSEFQKMKFMQLISPENLKKSPVNFDELKSGRTAISERVLIRKDGKEIWVETSAKLLSNGRFQSLVRDISDRIKVKLELKEKNLELKNLTAHIQNAREEERKYIAREIHDELGQLLTGLKFDISWLSKKIAPVSEELFIKTEEMLLLTDRTIDSVRRIATELRPGILDDLGLEEAIIWQVNEFQTKTGVKCKLIGQLKYKSFAPLLEITAFRILQESLTNITRYAKATEVIIKISDELNNFSLEINDNGIGISLDELKEKKSLGIMGMKERASIIGGILSISSSEDQGTTINILIPFNN